MLFTDEFINSFKDDPIGKTIEICDQTFSALADGRHEGWQEPDFEILAEAYSLLVEISELDLLPIKVTYPQLMGDISEDCARIYKYLSEIRERCSAEASKIRVQSLRTRFRVTLGNDFAYEFSQGDLDRVQQLINQLRNLITNADQLEKEHKQRLLRRLEKLQSEVHKKVSDLDRFWGLIGDAGVVLGKLGNDAKPIVDRIREIADIVWRTQSRAEELPSGTSLPSLEDKRDSEQI
ncbi:MAG: hypothetical protein MPW15_18650 [Candidatus Manganitrophus sp.]|nr:hypothetical protein [Candidatus Manganitrophus sp.]